MSSCPAVRIARSYLYVLGFGIKVLQVSSFFPSGSGSSFLPHQSNFQAYPNVFVKQPLSKTWGSFNELFHKEQARWRQLSCCFSSWLGFSGSHFSWHRHNIIVTESNKPKLIQWPFVSAFVIFIFVTFWIVVSWQDTEKYTLGDLFFAKKPWKPNCYPHNIQRVQHVFQNLQTAMRWPLYRDKVLPEAQI